MNFKIRKTIALLLTLLNISLAVFLHGYEYGSFILASSLLMLVVFIWFKDYFATVVRQPYRNEPGLLEFTGWVFLFIFLIFTVIAKNG